MTLENQLIEIQKNQPWFMDALDLVGRVIPYEWCIGAGAIRNIVFDHLDGSAQTPARDVDVVYFNAENLTHEKDKEYEGILKEKMPELPFEVTNQASVHLWFHKKFGYRVEPLNDIEDAVSTWPETCTAVGVSKPANGQIKVYAPLGLDDLFSMTIRRNPKRVDVKTYRKRIRKKQYQERWPGVTIIPE